MAAQLEIIQKAVHDHLKTIRKLLKARKWVPNKLNERQIEKRRTSCKMSHQTTKRTFLN